MRISLIATVRNERETIGAFLDSLLEQSRAPDEVVIVDGASTDGTLEVLNDYSQRSGVSPGRHAPGLANSGSSTALVTSPSYAARLSTASEDEK
jgi:glycosyltransferase involved in cell wall biosynthesis